MGNRAQVKVVPKFEHSDPVYLYTHWGGSELVETVARALNREERWGDDEYLARIIFEQMIDDLSERGNGTGLGIGTGQHGDVHTVVEVDVPEQEVRVVDVYDDRVAETHSFKEMARMEASA